MSRNRANDLVRTATKCNVVRHIARYVRVPFHLGSGVRPQIEAGRGQTPADGPVPRPPYPATVAGVRVRFAPSPTGALHLGSALTAVANFLFARRAGGEFVLRVDDTDPERSNRRYERTIRQDAEWLGLRFDEGPDKGGPFGPYRQSERHADLPRARRAAWCATGRAYREDGAIHFRAPTDDIVVHDAARGDVRVAVGAIKDFVIVRSDGTATYKLATAVDDALMEITHVIRGEDHLTNTARQLALFDALGAAPAALRPHGAAGRRGRRASCRSARARRRSPSCAARAIRPRRSSTTSRSWPAR